MTIMKVGHGRGSRRIAADTFVLGQMIEIRHAYRECKIEEFVPTSVTPEESPYYLCNGVPFNASSLDNAVSVVKASLDATYLDLHPDSLGVDLRNSEQSYELPYEQMAPGIAIVGSVAVRIKACDKAREQRSSRTLIGDSAIIVVGSGVPLAIDERKTETPDIGMAFHEVYRVLTSYCLNIEDPHKKS